MLGSEYLPAGVFASSRSENYPRLMTVAMELNTGEEEEQKQE